MQINQVNMQVKWAFTFHIFSATAEYRKQVLHQKKYIIQWHKVYLFPIREFLFCFRGKKEIKKNTFCFKFKTVSMDTELLLCDSEDRKHVACDKNQSNM